MGERGGLGRRHPARCYNNLLYPHKCFSLLALVLSAFLSAFSAMVSVYSLSSIPPRASLAAAQEVVHSCRELLGHLEALPPTGCGGGLSRLRRLSLHGYVDGSGDVDELAKVWSRLAVGLQPLGLCLREGCVVGHSDAMQSL